MCWSQLFFAVTADAAAGAADDADAVSTDAAADVPRATESATAVLLSSVCQLLTPHHHYRLTNLLRMSVVLCTADNAPTSSGYLQLDLCF